MISQEKALQYIDGMSNDQLRDMTIDRLNSRGSSVCGNGMIEEWPEQLLFALLKSSKLDKIRRKYIIDGCIRVYNTIKDGSVEERNNNHLLSLRLAWVINICKPKEFRLTENLNLWIEIIDNYFDYNSNLLEAACNALIMYTDIDYWIKMLQIDEIVAYAFNGVIDINPNHPRIEEFLLDMWERQINHTINVDLPFLMHRAERERYRGGLIWSILNKLKKESYWPEVQEIINKYDWSKKWLIDKG